MIDDAAALALVARLIGFATLLQALELWPLRSAFARDGIWDWRTLRRDHADAPAFVRAFLDVTLARAEPVLLLRVLAAIALLVDGAAPMAAVAALLGSLALSVRMRGRLNGGSDAMTHLVLLGVVVGSVGHVRAGLVFVAAQLVLAYVAAGVAKLRTSTWRQGRALPELLSIARYRTPRWLQTLAAQRVIATAAGIMVLGWELAFPLSLLDARACAAFLVVGVAFHIGNFVAFGLQRFVWAFGSAYPAVWWACGALHAASSPSVI